jgi:hypothetical protein
MATAVACGFSESPDDVLSPEQQRQNATCSQIPSALRGDVDACKSFDPGWLNGSPEAEWVRTATYNDNVCSKVPGSIAQIDHACSQIPVNVCSSDDDVNPTLIRLCTVVKRECEKMQVVQARQGGVDRNTGCKTIPEVNLKTIVQAVCKEPTELCKAVPRVDSTEDVLAICGRIATECGKAEAQIDL